MIKADLILQKQMVEYFWRCRY